MCHAGLCAVSSAAVHRYHVVYDLKNMTEARRHCRENYKDLATIRDQEDVETLKRTVDLSKMAASSSVSFMTSVTGGLNVLHPHSGGKYAMNWT